MQNATSMALFSSVFIVDFEQVNVSSVVSFQEIVAKTYQEYFFRVNETGHTFSAFEKKNCLRPRFDSAITNATKSFGT